QRVAHSLDMQTRMQELEATIEDRGSRTLLFYDTDHHQYLHSFPTRRSSDLDATPLAPKPHLVARDALVELGYSIPEAEEALAGTDRKSTRLNSSHRTSSYAVFCLKKKMNKVAAKA